MDKEPTKPAETGNVNPEVHPVEKPKLEVELVNVIEQPPAEPSEAD